MSLRLDPSSKEPLPQSKISQIKKAGLQAGRKIGEIIAGSVNYTAKKVALFFPKFHSSEESTKQFQTSLPKESLPSHEAANRIRSETLSSSASSVVSTKENYVNGLNNFKAAALAYAKNKHEISSLKSELAQLENIIKVKEFGAEVGEARRKIPELQHKLEIAQSQNGRLNTDYKLAYRHMINIEENLVKDRLNTPEGVRKIVEEKESFNADVLGNFDINIKNNKFHNHEELHLDDLKLYWSDASRKVLKREEALQNLNNDPSISNQRFFDEANQELENAYNLISEKHLIIAFLNAEADLK